jgi:hypothetical protein
MPVAAPPKIVGKETPRLFTAPLPGNINSLTGEILDDCTDGGACIAFAEDILGLKLFPWQKWLLNHALELSLDKTLYRFRVVIVQVARQNGKSTIEMILSLWHIFSLESGTVIGVSQNLDNSERVWKDAVAHAENNEILAELIQPGSPHMGHPKVFELNNGCEYRVASATAGGRGFPGDTVLVDEIREQHDWDLWASVKHTMNARPLAQAWCFSNAGDARSVVLRYQRALAHRDLGWPDGELEFEGVLDELDDEIAELLADSDDLKPGWFEWSAPPGAKRNDMDALAQSNPSLNHFEVTAECPTTRTLLSALSDPAYVYETEVMCRWATTGLGGPFPPGSWEATMAKPDEETGIPAVTAVKGSQRVVCIEFSAKRSQTYVARVTFGEGNTVVGGMDVDIPGTDGVVEYLLAHKGEIDAVVIRTETAAPTRSLFEEISADVWKWPELGRRSDLPEIIEWKGADIYVAHSQLYDRLFVGSVEHLPHPGLDMAATSAVTVLKPGGAWAVSITRSPTDTAPLFAFIGAVWGLALAEAANYDVMKSVW